MQVYGIQDNISILIVLVDLFGGDVRDKIHNYSKKTGAAVVWTSHNMKEIETMCNRVLFLSRGRVLLSGNPKTLPGQNGKSDLEELFIALAREPLSIDH